LRWSDGRPLNAYDFEYSAKRILSPCVQSPLATLLYDIKAGQSFHQGEVDDFSLVGLRALDESRLLIELEKPAPYFLHLLVNFVATPRHCIEAFGDNWTEPQHIVTSGPFHVQEWKSDELMLLAQFPNYHGKRTGNLQSVLLSLQPDPAANLASFAANELDVLDLRFYPMDFYEKALGQYWGEYYSLPAASISFLGFNTRKAPFDDQRVRRAFAMAFDKETLAGKVQRGTVFPASGGLAPPGLPGHTGGIGLQYDPGLAQECLAQAGYPNGNGFPELTALTPLETNDPISLFLAEQWKKVLGINLAWQTVSPGLYRVLDKEPPLLFLSYWHADYPDPDDFLGAGQFLRWTGWQDDHYLRLLEETRQTSNQSLRLNLFAQADRLLVQQAAIVPLAYLRQHFLIKPWVKRYPTTTLYSWFWKDVIIEAH
jgi:oligopeptide transport system substrate-binding protein